MDQDQVHPHPLLIELVLENVFKHLSTPTLLNCRLVCRKWYHEASKYFEPLNAHVFVGTSDALYQLLWTCLNSPGPSFPTFHLTLEWQFLNKYELELLFDVLGPDVASVTVTVSLRAPLDLASVLERLLRQVPNLKTLNFDGVVHFTEMSRGPQNINADDLPRRGFTELRAFKLYIMWDDFDVEYASTFFSALFDLMPLLKCLDVVIMELSMRNSCLIGFASVLRNNRALCQRLKSLTMGTVNGEILAAIHETGMKLEQLGLVAMFSVEEEALERVLRNQAPYLKSLTLGGTSTRPMGRLQLTNLRPPFQLPHLTEFKRFGELDAFQRGDPLEALQWQGLCWRHQMPKLKSLTLREITGLTNDNGDEVFSEWDDLRTLVVGATEEVPSSVNLGRLARAFPGLTELEVVVDCRESIELVFRSWLKLKRLKLSIVGDVLDIDEVFTGVQFEEDAGAEGGGAEVTPEKFEDAEGGCFEGSGITNLTELEDLTVEFRPALRFGRRILAGDGYLLSDVTGTLALLLMRKLNAVRINKSLMSRDFVNLLRTELNLDICIIKDRHERMIPPAAI